MKLRLFGHRLPRVVLDDSEIDPAADYTREWCVREAIKDDPSLTRATATALYRQATREALAGGF